MWPLPESPDERRPELRVGVGKLKAGTHDADNLVLNAVEHDRLSKNRVVTTETALPHGVTDDRDPVKAGGLFPWLQQSAHQGRRFEHRHDLGRYPNAVQMDGLPASAQRDSLRDVSTQIRQCPRAGPKELEILKAHRSDRRFDAAPIVWLELGGDPDKPIGTGIRQRAEQHGMDDAEDGGVGADAEREGADDDRGEPRRAQERARRESGVLTEVVEPPERPRIAMQLLRLRHSTKRASSRQAGLGVGQPPTLVLVLEDTEVRR